MVVSGHAYEVYWDTRHVTQGPCGAWSITFHAHRPTHRPLETATHLPAHHPEAPYIRGLRRWLARENLGRSPASLCSEVVFRTSVCAPGHSVLACAAIVHELIAK